MEGRATPSEEAAELKLGLVATTQGLQFIRYVPLLARRGAKVIVECQPQLVELPGTVEGAGHGGQVVARGEPLPRFDAHVRLASLPGMLGTRLGNVPAGTPYLRLDPRRVEEWKERVCQSSVVSGQLCSDRATSLFTLHSSPFPPCTAARGVADQLPATAGNAEGPEVNHRGARLIARASSKPPPQPSPGVPVAGDGDRAPAPPFRIGIAWQGDPTFHNDRERSVPLMHFAPLAAVPGVRLFTLQKNHGVEQLAAARNQFPITDFSPPLDDGCGAFVDTAAVMANLDLVVSSDKSIVHLAGALGVRVWMATSFGCDWRWLRDRDDSPW